jgi:hypothetical protein
MESDTRLLFPDYPGNHMFNTLGNIFSNPRTGVLVPDFQAGSALALSGRARILWDDPRMKHFEGAQRLVEFDIERVIEVREATRLRFEFEGYSPRLPGKHAATSEFRASDAQSDVASPQIVLHLIEPVDALFEMVRQASEQRRHLGVFEMLKLGDDVIAFLAGFHPVHKILHPVVAQTEMIDAFRKHARKE